AAADLVMMALVFVAVAAPVLLVMKFVHARGAVKRRAAGVSAEDLDAGGSSLRSSGLKAAQRLIDRTTRHYSSMDDKQLKMLRQRLVQAGIFNPRAVGFFFLT